MRLCATAAVSVLSLALVTGCGDEKSKDSGATSGKDAAKPAAKTLSAAELQKLIIAKGDVPGHEVGPVEGGVPDRGKVKAGDAKCEPVLQAFTGIAPGAPAANTSRMATQEQKTPAAEPTSPEELTEGALKDEFGKAMDMDVTVVTLASYDGDGAERALTSVQDAVKACAGGFSGEQDGEKGKFTKVAAEKSAGTGDASVAFTATNESGEDGSLPLHAEVVRHGRTLAVYTTVNIGAMMSKKPYTVSAPVMKAQAAKLK
ncbi:lipoprotein [Streptomyces nogalater]